VTPTDAPRERVEEVARNLRDLGLEPLIVAVSREVGPKNQKTREGLDMAWIGGLIQSLELVESRFNSMLVRS
jgi:hypothetical protein